MFKDKNVNVDFVEEEHGAVYNFFLVTGGNFFKLMLTNIVFVVFNLPSIAFAFLFTTFILPLYSSKFEINNFFDFWKAYGLIGNKDGFVPNDVGSEAINELFFLIVLIIAMFWVGTTLFSIVPIQTGFCQIYRNLYRRDIVSVWSDFKTGVKSNFKQNVIAMVISLLTTVILMYAIGFYWNIDSKLGTFLSTLLIITLFLFIIIQNMVYQMIVSVKLPLRKMYLNSILIFLIKPGKGLLLLVLEVFLLFGLPFILLGNSSYTAYSIALIGYTTIIFSFVQFVLSYYSCSMIDKYIFVRNEDSEDVNGDVQNTSETVETNKD